MNEIVKEIKELQLIMGWQCNARCVMCYQRDHDSAGNMSADIYKKYLLPLYPYLKRIIIQGGEPIVMPNCRELVQFVDQFPDIRFNFFTNGVCVDEFWVKVFMERADSIMFSINAATPNTYDRIVKYGDFNKVLGNIRRIIKGRINKKPSIIISTVLLKHNAHEIAEFIDLGHVLGADKVKFFVDPVLSFYKLPIKNVHKELDKARCVIGRTGMTVQGLKFIARHVNYPWGEGDVERRIEKCPYSSWKLTVDRSGNVCVCSYTWRVLGNLHKSSLEEILENWQRIRLQQMVDSGDYSWCVPHCPNNPAPRRIAYFNRCFYLLRRNPGEFLMDAMHRLSIRRHL